MPQEPVRISKVCKGCKDYSHRDRLTRKLSTSDVTIQCWKFTGC